MENMHDFMEAILISDEWVESEETTKKSDRQNRLGTEKLIAKKGEMK